MSDAVLNPQWCSFLRGDIAVSAIRLWGLFDRGRIETPHLSIHIEQWKPTTHNCPIFSHPIPIVEPYMRFHVTIESANDCATLSPLYTRLAPGAFAWTGCKKSSCCSAIALLACFTLLVLCVVFLQLTSAAVRFTSFPGLLPSRFHACLLLDNMSRFMLRIAAVTGGQTDGHTHARTHPRTHARTHAHTHTHTHTQTDLIILQHQTFQLHSAVLISIYIHSDRLQAHFYAWERKEWRKFHYHQEICRWLGDKKETRAGSL